MAEIEYTEWLNKEVQISLVSYDDHIQNDTKENATLKLKNQNEKEVNDNKLKYHKNVVEEENFLLKTKQTKCDDICQESCQKYDIANNETAALTEQTLLTNTNDSSNILKQTPRLKRSKKVTLELRPEHCIKKKKTSNPAEQESDHLKLLSPTETNKKTSGKVVLELRQEPSIKVIKTTTPIEVLEISDDDDDTTVPRSILLNDSKNNSTLDDIAFEVDEVDDNHVFKSIISIEKNDSLTHVLPKPSKKNPYICCGHSFYDELDIQLHKKLHKQKKSRQCDSQQLTFNGLVNSTGGKKWEKHKNFRQTDTQTSLPLSGSTNLAAVNKSLEKERSSDRDNVLEFTSSHSIDFIVSKIFEKQKKLCQRVDTQQLKSTSCTIDLTSDEEYDIQKISNQCDIQQLTKSSDAINLATINENCEEQNKTDKCNAFKLPSSTTIEIISNKKSEKSNKSFQHYNQTVSFSNPIDLTIDENYDELKKSGQCDTQQLLSDSPHLTVINKNRNEPIKLIQSDTIDLITNKKCEDEKKSDKYHTQQSSVCDTVHLTAINKNCDVLNTIDHCGTQQLSVSDSIDLAAIDKSCANKQKITNLRNTQEVSDPVINLTPNKCDGRKTTSLQHDLFNDLLQPIDTIDLTFDEKNDEPNKTVKYYIEKSPVPNNNYLVLDKCDKQIRSLQHNTQNLEFANTIVIADNLKSDNQSKSNLCDTQQLLISNSTNSDENKEHEEENEINGFNTCELSFPNKLVIKFRKNIQKPKINLYKCETCHMSFFASSELIEHIKIHSPKKKNTCRFCKQEFFTKSDLKIHLKTHKKRYKCDPCKQIFTKKSDFMCHVQTHTGYKPFKCTKCKMSFNRKSLILLHKRSHGNVISNECYLCFRTFIHESSLKRHLEMHSKKICFQCDSCKMCFNKKSNLVSHLQIHIIGKKSHVCKTCKTSFTTLSKLSDHMATHKDSKKCQDKVYSRTVKTTYQCSICNMSFKTFPSLSNHTKKHNIYRDYQCKVCKMFFNKKWLLKTHIKMLH